MEESPASPPPGGMFPTTQWTVIVEAVSENPERARLALERLCEEYRPAFIRWFRHKDFQKDPEELAQSFFAYLFEHALLSKVELRSGRFRYFLAACMKRFLLDVWGKAGTLKRGGGFVQVFDQELDHLAGEDREEPSRLDVELALAVHERVVKTLRGREELRHYIFHKDPVQGWNEIAQELGLSSDAVRQEIRRMRLRHWESFRDEVSRMVSPEHRAEETQYLYETLFKHPPVP